MSFLDEMHDMLDCLDLLGNQLKILGEVVEERRRQIQVKNYPPEHDDKHTLEEFVWIIEEYLQHIIVTVKTPSGSSSKSTRRDMLKATAVCMAALEYLDRREKNAGKSTS